MSRTVQIKKIADEIQAELIQQSEKIKRLTAALSATLRAAKPQGESGMWYWEDDVLLRNTVPVGYTSCEEESERIAAAHNADIDALTAERDEWKQRCEKIVAMFIPKNDDNGYPPFFCPKCLWNGFEDMGMEGDGGDEYLTCPNCGECVEEVNKYDEAQLSAVLARALAIMEGRDDESHK